MAPRTTALQTRVDVPQALREAGQEPLGEAGVLSRGPNTLKGPGGRVLRNKRQLGRSRPDGASLGSRVLSRGQWTQHGSRGEAAPASEPSDGAHHLTWGSRSYYHPLGG